MTQNERLLKIRKIKSYPEPPFISSDAYYFREPWQQFGGVSSGICMCWCWYRDDVILLKASDADIEMALAEISK